MRFVGFFARLFRVKTPNNTKWNGNIIQNIEIHSTRNSVQQMQLAPNQPI